MQMPLEISFRNMERSENVETDIRQRVAKLEEFCDRIIGCHVIVEVPHRHHRKGALYHVRIHITVPPRREISVDREPHEHQAHEELSVAIRDAFKAARRQLQDYTREIRGETKHHELPPHGTITKLFSKSGYGFIESPEGHEVYFNFNSVHDDDLEKLAIGSQVRFNEEPGDRGPQATSVQPVGRHHRMEPI